MRHESIEWSNNGLSTLSPRAKGLIITKEFWPKMKLLDKYTIHRNRREINQNIPNLSFEPWDLRLKLSFSVSSFDLSLFTFEKVNLEFWVCFLSSDFRIFVHPVIEMEPTVPSWWLPRNLVVCGGVSLHLLLRRATSINLKVVIYAVVCAPLYKPASASSVSVVS